MKIIGHLHTAFLVADLEKAEQFYSNVLGLSKINRILKYPGAWYQLGDFQLHLILEPNLVQELQNKEKWGRNHHIALAVDNLEFVKQCLEENGYSFQMSASGRKALFTQDPDGNVIELQE